MACPHVLRLIGSLVQNRGKCVCGAVQGIFSLYQTLSHAMSKHLALPLLHSWLQGPISPTLPTASLLAATTSAWGQWRNSFCLLFWTSITWQLNCECACVCVCMCLGMEVNAQGPFFNQCCKKKQIGVPLFDSLGNVLNCISEAASGGSGQIKCL